MASPWDGVVHHLSGPRGPCKSTQNPVRWTADPVIPCRFLFFFLSMIIAIIWVMGAQQEHTTTKTADTTSPPLTQQHQKRVVPAVHIAGVAMMRYIHTAVDMIQRHDDVMMVLTTQHHNTRRSHTHNRPHMSSCRHVVVVMMLVAQHNRHNCIHYYGGMHPQEVVLCSRWHKHTNNASS